MVYDDHLVTVHPHADANFFPHPHQRSPGTSTEFVDVGPERQQTRWRAQLTMVDASGTLGEKKNLVDVSPKPFVDGIATHYCS